MAIDRELTAIAAGTNKRLIIQMPPRHGKSQLASVFFPAWYLCAFPNRNVILTGATDELALGFSAEARNIVAEHGHLFGVGLSHYPRGAKRWKTTAGGLLRAAGVGGDIMGRGADLLIIDDYCKNIAEILNESNRKKMYEWYLTTSKTRLSPIGAQVIIATRWHHYDLIGMILQTARKTNTEWRVLSFPAIGDDGAVLWPEQWPHELLEPTRREYVDAGYPWMWDALYQQIPPESIDSEWPSHYFENVFVDDWPEERLIKVVALDPSLGKTAKSDYSAFVAVAMGHNGVFYVDANIARRPSSQIVDDGVAWLKWQKPDAFGVESVAFQELLRAEFERALQASRAGFSHGVWGIHGGDGAGSGQRIPAKITRIRGLTPYLARGRIKFLRSPGTALLLEQLKAFPNGKHDDGPDALEMAIRFAIELLSGSGAVEPEPDHLWA